MWKGEVWGGEGGKGGGEEDEKKKNVLKNKISQKISVLEDVEKLEHLCITKENIKDAAAVENSMEIPQKIKHRITL